MATSFRNESPRQLGSPLGIPTDLELSAGRLMLNLGVRLQLEEHRPWPQDVSAWLAEPTRFAQVVSAEQLELIGRPPGFECFWLICRWSFFGTIF